jgi:acyl carrier protein
MGLDSVELVMRAEEEFNITIEDSEAEQVRTVGDFYRLILNKLDLRPDCQTSRAFFHTRMALMDALAVPKRSIRPATDLEPLFPMQSRRKLWANIAQCIQLAFPQLKHTRTWRSRFITISLVVATAIVLTCWIAAFRLWEIGGGIVSFLAAAVAWVLLFSVTDASLIRWTPFLRDELQVANVGELARVVMGMNPSRFCSSTDGGARPSKDSVWTKLVEIFCDQLQIAAEEVVPDANIAQDLGVD